MMRRTRGRRRSAHGNGFSSLGEAMGGVLGRLGGRVNMKLALLWPSWPEIMGPELAKVARPLGHKRRTLVIGCEDPYLMQELTFLAPTILSNVNAFLGEEFFDKVVCELLQGRAPLDETRPLAVHPERPQPKKPKNLGRLKEYFDKDSAVGKCYRAYVDMFAEKNEPAGRRKK